jgi:hypothetical protein
VKKRPKSFDQSGKFRGVVKQSLGYAGAPCLGYWGFYHQEGGAYHPIHLPGLDVYTEMGADAVIEIEYTFRVVKRGKVPHKKCMNPWPAHRCPEKRKARKKS